MGKDSLLESTSKKKAAAKADKKKATKKSTAAKKAAAKKTTAKSKTAAKATKTAKAKAKKTTAPKKATTVKKADTAKAAAALAAKAKEEAKRKAEEEAKRKAEEEAKRKAEEEAKRKAEEEAKRKAEEEAQRKAEEEAKRKAEEEAKRKAEEDAKRKAEEEAQRKAAEMSGGLGSGFNPIKIGIIGFCAIIALLIFSSYSNTKHYYIEEKDGAVEIWRGTFAPMGKTRLMIMPGIQMPQEQKEVYAWQDAYRLMYQYYIDKADAILEVPGMPDTAGLITNLEKAISYAPNRELRDAARARMVGIRVQTLVHKAQAALNRGTIESATAAIGFLKEAAQYDMSAAEADMVQRKIEDAEKVLADREKDKAAAEKAAAEKAALEAEAQELKEAAENEPPVVKEADH